MKSITTLSLFTAVTSLLSTTAFAGLNLIPINESPGSGFHTGGIGISKDGSTIGARVSDAGAFIWNKNHGEINIPQTQFGNEFFYEGINSDGSVLVGVSGIGNTAKAFRYKNGAFTSLGNLTPSNFSNPSEAEAVSADGSVIVGDAQIAYVAGVVYQEAFRWTEEGGMQGLGHMPGSSVLRSHARDVSNDGSVIVGFGNSSNGGEAFRWTQNDGMVGLGDLPGGNFNSRAYAVSGDGKVIGGYSQSELSGDNRVGFKWTEENGMAELGSIEGRLYDSFIYDIDYDGSTIVGRAGGVAALWYNDSSAIDLKEFLISMGVENAEEWLELGYLFGISDDGNTALGLGVNASGNGQLFLVNGLEGALQPVPEPSQTALLIGIFLVGVTYVRAKKKK